MRGKLVRSWGLCLALALVLLMGFGIVQPFVAIAVILGLIAQVEGLLISVVLPVWTHDVPTINPRAPNQRNPCGRRT